MVSVSGRAVAIHAATWSSWDAGYLCRLADRRFAQKRGERFVQPCGKAVIRGHSLNARAVRDLSRHPAHEDRTGHASPTNRAACRTSNQARGCRSRLPAQGEDRQNPAPLRGGRLPPGLTSRRARIMVILFYCIWVAVICLRRPSALAGHIGYVPVCRRQKRVCIRFRGTSCFPKTGHQDGVGCAVATDLRSGDLAGVAKCSQICRELARFLSKSREKKM
jgi:hypothetical protein